MRNSDPDHPAAKAVRAARAYAGMSRTQLGDEVGVVGDTIGRYERGDWREGPPRISLLEGIARATKINTLVEDLASATEQDPARRFAAVARKEAQRRNGRPESDSEAPPDEGAGGGGS